MGTISPRGEKLATIVVVPKLGPHGSLPGCVGVEVTLNLTPTERNTLTYEDLVDALDGKTFEITVPVGKTKK